MIVPGRTTYLTRNAGVCVDFLYFWIHAIISLKILMKQKCYVHQVISAYCHQQDEEARDPKAFRLSIETIRLFNPHPFKQAPYNIDQQKIT